MNCHELHGHLTTLGFRGPTFLHRLGIDKYTKRIMGRTVPNTIQTLERDLLITRRLLEEILGPDFAKYDPHAFQRFQLVGACDKLETVGLSLGCEGAVSEEKGNYVVVDVKKSGIIPGHMVVNHRIRAESVLENYDLSLRRLNQMEAAYEANHMPVEKKGLN